jgi:hypothetical protein
MADIRDDLRKGALVARNPLSYEKVADLDTDEKAALYTEATRKWKQPVALYVTIITCSVGAAVQSVASGVLLYCHSYELDSRGWDQTGSNGANLSFPAVFGIGSKNGADPWLVGLVNAAPYLGSSFV